MTTTLHRTEYGYETDGFRVVPQLDGNLRQQGWNLLNSHDEWMQTYPTLRQVREAISQIRSES